MSTFNFFFFAFCLILFTSKYEVYSIPTCVIIDTNTDQHIDDEITNRTLRNLRTIDHQGLLTSPEFIVQSIPLSYIDLKQTSAPPLIDIDSKLLKKSLTEPIIDRSLAPCSLKSLDEIETQMVVPFEFRRLRIEQPDHYSKFVDDDPREILPDLSTAVYERRSDPDGIPFCRTCQDGSWTPLTVCETVRCDAESLRANPRLVTEWGEIKPIDGGALYAPSTVYAIYAFAFGPHCKRCESNGQWSKYALAELCSGIKFFGHSTTTPMTKSEKTNPTLTTTTTTATTATTTKTKTKTTITTTLFNKLIFKKQ